MVRPFVESQESDEAVTLGKLHDAIERLEKLLKNDAFFFTGVMKGCDTITRLQELLKNDASHSTDRMNEKGGFPDIRELFNDMLTKLKHITSGQEASSNINPYNEATKIMKTLVRNGQIWISAARSSGGMCNPCDSEEFKESVGGLVDELNSLWPDHKATHEKFREWVADSLKPAMLVTVRQCAAHLGKLPGSDNFYVYGSLEIAGAAANVRQQWEKMRENLTCWAKKEVEGSGGLYINALDSMLWLTRNGGIGFRGVYPPNNIPACTECMKFCNSLVDALNFLQPKGKNKHEEFREWVADGLKPAMLATVRECANELSKLPESEDFYLFRSKGSDSILAVMWQNMCKNLTSWAQVEVEGSSNHYDYALGSMTWITQNGNISCKGDYSSDNEPAPQKFMKSCNSLVYALNLLQPDHKEAHENFREWVADGLELEE